MRKGIIFTSTRTVKLLFLLYSESKLRVILFYQGSSIWLFYVVYTVDVKCSLLPQAFLQRITRSTWQPCSILNCIYCLSTHLTENTATIVSMATGLCLFYPSGVCQVLYFAFRIITLVSCLLQICISRMHFFIKGKDPELNPV